MDSFLWYAEKLPYYNTEINKPELTPSMRKFIDSFNTGGNDVYEKGRYILYGKGLRLDESIND